MNRKKSEYLISQINEELGGESFSMRIFFPNRKTYVATIRDSLRHLFLHFPLTLEQTNRMLLIADEIMNNAVTYGSADGDINQFRVEIAQKDKHVSIVYEMEDTGRNVFSRNAHEMELLLEKNKKTWHEDLTRQRGRGYHMITEICDALRFLDSSRGGLIVRSEISYPLDTNSMTHLDSNCG